MKRILIAACIVAATAAAASAQPYPSRPYIIVGKNALPKTLPELIAHLKANPDKLTEGTGGAGSGQHVGGVYFQKVTGTSFQFVPYRAGSSDVMRDVMAGHIDISIDQAI